MKLRDALKKFWYALKRFWDVLGVDDVYYLDAEYDELESNLSPSALKILRESMDKGIGKIIEKFTKETKEVVPKVAVAGKNSTGKNSTRKNSTRKKVDCREK